MFYLLKRKVTQDRGESYLASVGPWYEIWVTEDAADCAAYLRNCSTHDTTDHYVMVYLAGPRVAGRRWL